MIHRIVPAMNTASRAAPAIIGPLPRKATSETAIVKPRPAAPAAAADQRAPAIRARISAIGERARAAVIGRRAQATFSVETSCTGRPVRSKAVTFAIVVSAMLRSASSVKNPW